MERSVAQSRFCSGAASSSDKPRAGGGLTVSELWINNIFRRVPTLAKAKKSSSEHVRRLQITNREQTSKKNPKRGP